MHTIELFNVGNGDTSLITLANDRLMLVDFCDRRAAEDDDDPRIHLSKRLREILKEKKRSSFDVVAFTHIDLDHIAGSTSFFYLEHAAEYQSSDRIKIDVMWVPAGAILEEGLKDEARIIRQEARHRLRKGKGIRVFSRPDALKAWLEGEGLTLKDREGCITDAGKLAPEFSLANDGAEFFIHAPLARRMNDTNDGKIIDRNQDCLVFQTTFTVEGESTRVLFTGDMTHMGWADIVAATKEHKREERLNWDLYNVAHHCSYGGIGPDKGKDKTAPTDEVKWLLEDQGQGGGYIVSSSNPTPAAGSEEDKNDQPPHRQAANYYKDVAVGHGGKFLVTMETPSTKAPEPIVFEIVKRGLRRRTLLSAPAVITSQTLPRAG